MEATRYSDVARRKFDRRVVPCSIMVDFSHISARNTVTIIKDALMGAMVLI